MNVLERRPQEISELAGDVAEMVEWLESHIPREAANTRIGKYRSCIKKLFNLLAAKNYDSINNDIPTYDGALLELHELLVVYREFPQPNNVVGLLDLLECCISGTLDRHDPTDVKSSARDFFFEALFGSRIHSADVDVQFPESSEANPDVLAIHGDQHINIQCKRLNSAKTTEKRLKKAMSQLDVNWETSPSSLGIVAMEVSKILNPDKKIWVSESQKAMHKTLDCRLKEYVGDHVQKIVESDVCSDSRLIGIILYSSQLYYDMEVDSRCYLPGVLYIPFYNENTTKGAMLEKICGNIFKSRKV